MTPPLDSFGLDAEFASPPVAPAHKVFVRTVTAPPGLPWDQHKAAELEALHGAPMSMQDMTLQMRRMEGWRFGAPARFAALYVPSRSVGERLQTTVLIDGASVEVVFLSPAARAARGRHLLIVAGVVAIGVALTVAAVGSAVSRQSETELQLAALESRTSARVRAMITEQHQREQGRALDALVDRGAALNDVVADLAAVSVARTENAQIVGFHWEAGAMAIEARGNDTPLVNSGAWTIRRAAKPIRRGIHLWLLTAPGGARAEPVVADLKDRGGG